MAFVKQLKPLTLANSPRVAVVCEFDVSEYSPVLFNDYHIEFPAAIANAAAVRQAEFLAGRIAATHAFRNAGQQPATIAIGPQRAPLWPANVSGSITHNRDTAICGIADEPLILGIDLEKILDDGEAATLAPQIVSDSELQILRPERALGWRLSLAFSAKESLFKGLYPLVNQYFDFLDVAISHVDFTRQQLTINLLKTLNSQCQKDREFTISWQDYGDQHILSSIVSR